MLIKLRHTFYSIYVVPLGVIVVILSFPVYYSVLPNNSRIVEI